MEDIVLDSVSTVGNVDFALVLRLFLYVYIFFWIMIVLWVWFDASERSSNVLFRVFSVFIVLIFNVFGLLIYLLIRPSDSYEERYLGELEKKYLQFETGGLINCPKCKFDLEPGFVVCPKCGESLRVKCENCNMYTEKTWEFCPYCGIEREVEENMKDVKLEDRKDSFKPKESKFSEFLEILGGKIIGFFTGIGNLFKNSGSKFAERKRIKYPVEEYQTSNQKKEKKKKKKKRRK
jgi:hypothetical protein